MAGPGTPRTTPTSNPTQKAQVNPQTNMLQFITFREADFSCGIDAQSSENRIPDGYVADLTNANPRSTGQIQKRAGYQGWAGEIPLRVAQINYTTDSTNNIQLVFDSSIQIPIGKSSPLLITGRTNSTNNPSNLGDFPNNADAVNYYTSYTYKYPVVLTPGTTTVTIPQSQHGFTTDDLWVGTAISTNTNNQSNETIFPSTIQISKSTRTISITMTNSTGANLNIFIYIADMSLRAGSTYVTTNSFATGTHTLTIPAGTHSLTTFQIVGKCFLDDGTNLTEIIPQSLTVSPTTGEVDVTIANGTGSSVNIVTILTNPSSNPINNFNGTGTIGANTTTTFTFPAGGTSTNFVTCYLVNGSVYEQLIPQTITYDDSTGNINITVSNLYTASSYTLYFYWVPQLMALNSVYVTGAVIGAGFIDTLPQLTVYGFIQDEMYGSTRENREGWVTHIDSYRASGEERIVAGLGGNFYASRLQSEQNPSTTTLPTLFPSLNARISSTLTLSPCIYETGNNPGRTRGYITADGGGTNVLEVTAITYNSGSGHMDYTISAPNVTVHGTLGTVLNTNDQLTVSQCGHRLNEGIFQIAAVSVSANTITISVSNVSVTNSDYDEVDVGGLAGVFTDYLQLTATSKFISGDVITSAEFPSSTEVAVVSSTGSTVVVDGIVDIYTLPTNLEVIGARVSSVIPVRNSVNTNSVTNLVRGDMLSYSPISRLLRVRSINQLADISVSITSDGMGTGTVTLLSGDNSTIFAGKMLFIYGSAHYNGTLQVDATTGTTQFTFDTDETASDTGTLLGYSVEVDEDLSFADSSTNSTSLSVSARWIPYEITQDTAADIIPRTKPRPFDSSSFSNMNTIRSVMVRDNMYLNDYVDECMKIDGANISRAGLFRHQSQLFATTDTTATGKIVAGNPTAAITSSAVNQFTVTAGQETRFSTNDEVVDSRDGATYSIISIDTTNHFVTVSSTISGSSTGTLTKLSTYKYYTKLNAIDVNGNIVNSAVVNSGDCAVQLSADAAVYLRYLGMPALGTFDYSRIELQIFRTRGNGQIFYLLTTLPIPFTSAGGYITYTDTSSDFDLIDLDDVNNALVGTSRLGTGWEMPLRAKYSTTANNRLILGNIQDYPQIDIVVMKKGNILTQSIFTTSGNSKWLFLRDDTDSSTNTDMTNRFTCEFVSTAGAVAITPATDIANNSGTSFTVTKAAHGLVAGNWVYMYHDDVADAHKLEYAGWYQINAVTANTFTANHTHSSAYTPGASDVDTYVTATNPLDIPVLIGTDGNVGGIISGNRTSTQPYEFLSVLRLAQAVNAGMRNTDITLSPTFTPWVTAGAGNDFNLGQIVLRQPSISEENITMAVRVPNLTGDFNVFVNNISVSANSLNSAVTNIYPSRVIISYINYPEIFDSPTALQDFTSDSAIDVNSSDGQEITGVIPFFGETAFGAAQNANVLVIFKTNSVYLVDLVAKANNNGAPIIQKLDTFGKGCTAPFSIASTYNGIMFANEAGLYRINQNMGMEYLGRRYEKKWQNVVNIDFLNSITGTHDPFTHSYKCSYPVDSDSTNSLVAVYDHTKEYESTYDIAKFGMKILGAWTTYDNHPATGWTNLGNSAYFGTSTGRVMQVRRNGDNTDFRDDNAAVSMSASIRPLDMGDSGRRKLFSRVITHYRTKSTTVGTTLSVAMNTNSIFQPTDALVLRSDGTQTGTSDMSAQTIFPIVSTVEDKIGVYIQCQYLNDNIDEPVEITSIDFRVAPLDDRGITQAANTK